MVQFLMAKVAQRPSGAVRSELRNSDSTERNFHPAFSRGSVNVSPPVLRICSHVPILAGVTPSINLEPEVCVRLGGRKTQAWRPDTGDMVEAELPRPVSEEKEMVVSSPLQFWAGHFGERWEGMT
jgi:hypothetical protein